MSIRIAVIASLAIAFIAGITALATALITAPSALDNAANAIAQPITDDGVYDLTAEGEVLTPPEKGINEYYNPLSYRDCTPTRAWVQVCRP